MGKAIRVLLGSSPQDYVLLRGERDKHAPFSTNLRSEEPFDMPVERFLAMCRFENRNKLDDLGLEIDQNALKLSD